MFLCVWFQRETVTVLVKQLFEKRCEALPESVRWGSIASSSCSSGFTGDLQPPPWVKTSTLTDVYNFISLFWFFVILIYNSIDSYKKGLDEQTQNSRHHSFKEQEKVAAFYNKMITLFSLVITDWAPACICIYLTFSAIHWVAMVTCNQTWACSHSSHSQVYIVLICCHLHY